MTMDTGQVLARQTVYRGGLFNVRRDTVLLEDGKGYLREVVEHGPAVCVLPVDGQGNTILVEQYRHGVGANTLEACAGGMEPGEASLQAAMRELREETGLTGRDWTSLGDYIPTPGYCEEIIHLWFCRVDGQCERCPDEDEFLTLHTLPLTEVARRILDGEIRDGKTACAVLKVQALAAAGRL